MSEVHHYNQCNLFVAHFSAVSPETNKGGKKALFELYSVM